MRIHEGKNLLFLFLPPCVLIHELCVVGYAEWTVAKKTYVYKSYELTAQEYGFRLDLGIERVIKLDRD